MFFFFKQKTAYEMRISDWSTDVCSSDLRLISNFERLCDERERDIVLAVPVDFETVAVVGNLTRRLRPRTPTQRGGMKVVRVCQVHNIIDEQTIVTLSADIKIGRAS